MRKLLTDQIRSAERTNLVQSKNFREALEDAMTRYTNKAITTAEMIARLMDLAKWVREVQNRGQELGLGTEETAFYDAIAENESARLPARLVRGRNATCTETGGTLDSE